MAKRMATKPTIHRQGKTVQQDQVVLRMDQWEASNELSCGQRMQSESILELKISANQKIFKNFSREIYRTRPLKYLLWISIGLMSFSLSVSIIVEYACPISQFFSLFKIIQKCMLDSPLTLTCKYYTIYTD